MEHNLYPAPKFRFGLRRQLIAALGLLSLLLLTVSVTMFISLTRIRTLAARATEVEGQMNRLSNEVALQTLMCRRFEKDLLLHIGDPTVRSFDVALWHGAYQNLDNAINRFQLAATTPEDQQQAELWQAQSAHYKSSFVALSQAIDQKVITNSRQSEHVLRPVEEDVRTLTTSALNVARLKAIAAQQAGDDLAQRTRESTRLVMVIGALALVIALLWSLLLPAWLMRPIAALQLAAGRLAGGDLTARVGLARDDEIGALAASFDHMAATIQQRTSDREAQYQLANTAHAEAEAARSEIAAQLATIERQRAVIREMSVPILPLSATTLVMPLIGSLDAERLQSVQEQALRTIQRSSARYLILDITGVPVVDTAVAQGLIQVVQAARLLGSQTVLVGIRPEIAQTMVGLGIKIDDVVTCGTLQSGIAYTLRKDPANGRLQHPDLRVLRGEGKLD